MNKTQSILFYLRLFLYFSAVGLIFVHPGIAVSFDKIGIMQWFVIIPVMALAAFYPKVTDKKKKLIILAALLLLLSVIAAGFSFFTPLIAGLAGFILTFLLFHHSHLVIAKLAALEPFFLAWVCLRLLSLSRSGEDIAGQSFALTQFILVWTAIVFLLHSAVIYLCLYPKSGKKVWKEGLVFLLGALAVMLVIFVVLPPDFVRNAIINNLLSERIPQRIGSSETDRGIEQRGGRRTLPRGERGLPGLRGLPEQDWGRGGGSGDTRQYMVMVVASKREPVYMGNSIRGLLDPVEGFIVSPGEQFNSIASQRFFITWSNNERELDFGRESQEVFSLSTLHQKYLPWRPVVIDPVILSENTGPLRYIHQVVSNTHTGDPLLLVNEPLRALGEREKYALAHYLEIPLDAGDREMISAYLNNVLETWQKNREKIIQGDGYLREIFSDTEGNEYMEKIIAILENFSKYQYNLNYDDDRSIDALKHFLFNSAEGDCVEFSNTLALLGRLAGVPSRVVTGYLAADGLQTIAHLRGLAALRARIPALQKFPLDNLYMVTNIHGHSWTQFYIPDYGWIDFESTLFAIPPVGMGDFNNWDVVIPLLDEERTFSQIRKFPWQAVGKAAIFLVIFAVAAAYIIRYTRELILYMGTQRGGRQAARSLYLLLLAQLAADGKPIKPAFKTAHEYWSSEEQHYKTFADIYSELRWRHFSDSAEMEKSYQLLYNEYKAILSLRKSGLLHSIKRIISLRGLAYL